MRAKTLHLRLPTHPLLRLLVLAGGALAFVGLLAMGVVVGTLALVAAAGWLVVRRWLGGRRHGRQGPSIIEGEFSVVRERPRDGLPPGG